MIIVLVDVEVALGAVALVAQRHHRPPPLGDVLQRAHDAVGPALAGAQERLEVDRQPRPRAVRPAYVEDQVALGAPGLQRVEHGVGVRRHALAVLAEDLEARAGELAGGAPDELLAREAEDPRGGVVGLHDAAVGGQDRAPLRPARRRPSG